MHNYEMLKLENQLCFSIYSASRAITKLYRPFLQEVGLTYPQYLVMMVLWEKESITLKELGDKLFLDSGTLTPLLKRLEGMDIVKRERGKDDERVLYVTITDKGMKMRDKASTIPECVMKATNADMELLVRLKKDTDKLISILNL